MSENNPDSSEGEEQFEHHHNISSQDEIDDPEDLAQKSILEEEQEKFKQSNRNILSDDVQFKLEEVLEDIKEDQGKNFQSIITLRMKQLAYNKILVLTYQKSYFRLVVSHFHIGKQYLKFGCLEQAEHHLKEALKNFKDVSSNIHKLYYSYLLAYLGETYFFFKRYEEALQQLTRAINLQEQCQGKSNIKVNNIRTLKYCALVKSELKHEDALSQIRKAVEKARQFLDAKTKSSQGLSHRVYGLLLYDQGRIQLRKNRIEEAISKFREGLEEIKLSNQSGCEEDIIRIYQELADIYQSGNSEQYLKTLKQKYQVFEDTYGNADKRAIKEQRNLVSALLKHKRIEESLEECEDILEKEKRVYGQNSLEVGKELRTIANIYIAKNQPKQAEINFKKAVKIFHDLGEQRLVREVKVKLSTLQAFP